MNVTKDAPTPYRAKKDLLIDARGKMVAVVYGELSGNLKAPIDFIVRACNSHDALVEACMWSIKKMKREFPTEARCRWDGYKSLCVALSDATA